MINYVKLEILASPVSNVSKYFYHGIFLFFGGGGGGRGVDWIQIFASCYIRFKKCQINLEFDR